MAADNLSTFISLQWLLTRCATDEVRHRRLRPNCSTSLILTVVIAAIAGVGRVESRGGPVAGPAAAGSSTGSRYFRESPSASAASIIGRTTSAAVDPCYDEEGKARRCIPDFVNAAFGREIVASSTCGSPPTVPRCAQQQTGSTRGMRSTGDPTGGFGSQCFACDASSPQHRHPASYLTDNNNPNNLTCWASEPFVDAERNVTLTLRLGKKYEAGLLQHFVD
jgi:hypothetical protein